MNIEEKISRLEEISRGIKDSETSFEDQLKLYREGALLAGEIEKELEKAEQIIEEISSATQRES